MEGLEAWEPGASWGSPWLLRVEGRVAQRAQAGAGDCGCPKAALGLHGSSWQPSGLRSSLVAALGHFRAISSSGLEQIAVAGRGHSSG